MARSILVRRANWKRYLADVRVLEPDRERLRRALIWGVFTVHSGVAASERDFDHYMRNGTFRNRQLTTRRWRAIGDINAYIEALDFKAWLRRPLGKRIQSFVD